MSTSPTLADGEEFVRGRSQAKARELVELAEKAGLKGSVKTSYSGYIVPSAIFADRDETPKEETPQDEAFDPSAHTIEQVKTYLESADDDEFARVIAAEQETAKPRKGITDLADTTEEGK